MVRNRRELGAHVADGDLLAFHDGELVGRRRTEVEIHVQRCTACTTRLGEVRHGSVVLSQGHASADVRAPTRAPSVVRRRARLRRFRRRAAAAVAAAGLLSGGVAALTPGSALRTWLSHSSRSVPEATEVTHFSVTAPDSLAIALVDRTGDLLIRLVGVAGPRIEVRGAARDTLGHVEFAEGRLVLSAGTAQMLRILVPFRTVLWIESGEGAPALGAAERVSAPLGDSVDLRLPSAGPPN